MKIHPGGTIKEPGSSQERITGQWREGERPKWNEKKCIHCLICANFCPENAIALKDGKVHHINYTKCKGCGICANECPVKAILMVEE